MMLPEAFITEWKLDHPWVQDEFVEQDLILSRLLVELYSNKIIKNELLFRGGTALHKIFLSKPYRYSEDLDFVQINPGSIGPIISEIRKVVRTIINSKPRYEAHHGRVILRYKYKAENPPHPTMKIKIEINSREHFALDEIHFIPFGYNSQWSSGLTKISTYSIEELLATKLRALYQRRKGRDLFDIWISKELNIDNYKVINFCQKYFEKEGLSISRKLFLSNLEDKIKNPQFQLDTHPLMGLSINKYFVQSRRT